ncbi:MAG: nuclear transport factor 2 family protein [Olsenella sp.]|jgi:ketosteroid isomerase-like protein
MTKATETMKEYLNAVQALDIDKVISMFADDVSQGVPFAPEGTPDMIEGKEAVGQNFRGLPMMFKKLAYSDVEIVETTDPNFAVGFAHADGELPTGDPYVQNYVFYMRLDDAGKIHEYREYMNPVALGKALALLGGGAE